MLGSLTRVAALAPPGVTELVLAAYFGTTWVSPTLLGDSAPYDLRAILGAEFAYLLLAAFSVDVLRDRDRRTEEGFALAALGVMSLVLLGQAAGLLAGIGFGLHVISTIHWMWRDPVAARRLYWKHLVQPLLLLAGVGAALLVVPVPYLGWGHYGVPTDLWMRIDDLPRPVPNWYPATGFMYFFVVGLVKLAKNMTSGAERV